MINDMILTLYFVQLVEILLSQRLGRQNRQMGLWPVALKSFVGRFIKVWAIEMCAISESMHVYMQYF